MISQNYISTPSNAEWNSVQSGSGLHDRMAVVAQKDTLYNWDEQKGIPHGEKNHLG